MARIPDDPEGFGDLRGLFGDRPVLATGHDFGAEVGRAIEGLGDAIGKAGERLGEKKDDELEPGKEPDPPEQPKPAAPEGEPDFVADFDEKNRRVQGAEDGFADVFLRSELESGSRATRQALEREMSAADTDFAPKFRQQIARARRDVFNDMRNRFRLSPEAFQTLEESADGVERGVFARTMAAIHNARVLRVAALADEQIDALTADVQSGEVELEPALALAADFAAVRGQVVPDGLGVYAQDKTRQMFSAFGEGLIARNPREAPELIRDGILAGGGLSRDETEALRVRAERAKRQAEATSAGEIEDQIRAGSAGTAEIDAAVRMREIPESAATRLAELSRNAAAGREKAAMGAARIADVMLGRGAVGDPADPETRAAVEAFTESTLPDPMAMVPAETAARIVQQTGILPSRVAVSLKAGLAEGADPARRNEALVTYMLLKSQAPGVLEAEIERQTAADPLKPLTTSQDLATYDIAGSFVGAGIEPDEAFRLAQAEAEGREAAPADSDAEAGIPPESEEEAAARGAEEAEPSDTEVVPADNDAEVGILPEGEEEAAARGEEDKGVAEEVAEALQPLERFLEGDDQDPTIVEAGAGDLRTDRDLPEAIKTAIEFTPVGDVAEVAQAWQEFQDAQEQGNASAARDALGKVAIQVGLALAGPIGKGIKGTAKLGRKLTRKFKGRGSNSVEQGPEATTKIDQAGAEEGLNLPQAVSAAPNIRINSRIKNSPFAKRQAESMSEQAQRDADSLIGQVQAGNRSPGIGSRPVPNESGFIELRGKSGGRVIVKRLSAAEFDIVGKFQGHKRGPAANSRIIRRLISDYKKGQPRRRP